MAYKNDLIVTDLPEFGENCELKVGKLQTVYNPTVYFGSFTDHWIETNSHLKHYQMI